LPRGKLREENSARSDFEREVFVLSSGECVTATRTVQAMRFVLQRRRNWRGARFSEERIKSEGDHSKGWKTFSRCVMNEVHLLV
jgi:hypothetical protein